jgi:hypothetical protein
LPINGQKGDVLPSNTVYTWGVSTNGNITGSSPVSTPQTSISQTLTNTSFAIQKLTYTVTPVSGNCTGANFTIEVTVNPLPQIIFSNNTPLCVRDTNRLGVSFAGGTWKSLNPSIATVNASTGLVTGISDGIATIRYVVAAAGGCVDSLDIQVTIRPLPILSIVGSNSICIGTTTQLTSNEASGTWTSLNPSVATVDVNGVVSGIATGTTRFIFTSSTTGCSDTTATVTVGSFPSVSPITAPLPVVCRNNYLQLSNSTAGGTWSLSNGNAIMVSGPNVMPLVLQGVAEGQVYVTYTVGVGTCQSKATYSVKVVPTTPPTMIIGIER